MKPDYKFRVPIYHDSQIYLFFDERRFKEFVDKNTAYNVDKIGAINGYSMWNTNNTQTHFAIYTVPTCTSTIYHESLHISWWILENHNVKIDEDNHEALTYLQGYIAEEIIKRSKKYLDKEEKDG
jgi:hypothetical protein